MMVLEEVPAKSRLACALKRVLDETYVFESRKDWAFVLGVTSGAISQWLSDKTLPRANTLRSLLDTLRTRVAEDYRSPVIELEQLLLLPSKDVSPTHAHTIGRTLQDYIIEPAVHALVTRFKATLRDLGPREQEDLVQRIASALPGLIDPQRERYLKLTEQYPAGTQIDETDLPDILSTRLWERVLVVSKSPYELLTDPGESRRARRDDNDDLILNIYQASLKYLVNKCGAEVSYIVAKKEDTIERLNRIVDEVFGSDPDLSTPQRLIDARIVDPGNFERARTCAARRFRDGGEAKPTAMILFNPNSDYVFGYSWFEDTAGCILDARTIEQVLNALNVHHIEQNIIHLNSRRPQLRSTARSSKRTFAKDSHE